MKRWSLPLIALIVIAIVAVLVAGCGGSGSTASGGDSGTGQQGPVGQAESAACAGNRNIISSALRQYDAVEGASPKSIQALVPDYMQSVPTCPSGGKYSLQGYTVICSVHGS